MSIASVPASLLGRQRLFLREPGLWQFPLVMLGLAALATALPVLRGHSSWLQAFTEGKQALFYLFVIYCLAIHRSVHVLVVKQLIVVLGVVLSLQVIVFLLLGAYPPGFLPIDPVFPQDSRSIHVMYPQLISAALFLVLFDKSVLPRPLGYIHVAPVLAAGVLLQEHLSVTLATLLAICIVVIRADMRRPKRIILLGIAILAGAVGTIALVAALPDWLLDSDARFVQALISRVLIGEVRIAYLAEHVLFGYGFIHESSQLGLAIGEEARGLHDLRLATIDAGYLDLLLKFGTLGTVVAVWLYVRFCRAIAVSAGPESRALVVYLLLFLAVMLTWSVLTYMHGIVFIGMAALISLPRFRRGAAYAGSGALWRRASAQ
jgi:hypothetical protein